MIWAMKINEISVRMKAVFVFDLLLDKRSDERTVVS
jgi:hypothetical protein